MSGRVVFVVVLAAATTAAVYWPHVMVGPGPLVAGHAELAKDCWACHSPLRGVPAAKCTGCHGPESFRSDADSSSLALSRFHEHLGSTRCIRCHREHLGAAAAITSFDHSLLRAGDAEECAGCHQGDVPADALHQGVRTPCTECHQTRAWRPARFDHDPFFRLDHEHTERGCVGCHEAEGGYQTYQCLGCHEHRADHLEREHREEGVASYSERCAECHASPNEHDAKSKAKSRSKAGSGESLEPGRGKPDSKRRYRREREAEEHEHDEHDEHQHDDD